MRTPCPFCGAVTLPCSCEEDYLKDCDAEDLAKALRDKGWAVTAP